MAKNIVEGAELPITNQPEKGPGVVDWETRKEKNNAPPFSPETITKNFEENKASMFAAVRGVL